MNNISQDAAYAEMLNQSLNEAKPDLHIKIRRPLAGGLSGAGVYLADCQLGGEQRLGVVKLVSAKRAASEEQGDTTARNSWLKPFLPEQFLPLGELSAVRRIAFLSTLARDRMEDCQTLSEILEHSLPYGADHVLAALGFSYRRQAESQWSASSPSPAQDCFRLPLSALGDAWIEPWNDTDLPAKQDAAIIFEDSAERWPNPVAYLFDDGLWRSKGKEIRVPSIWGHGDLNPQNILAPSYQRAHAAHLVRPIAKPQELLKHLSMVDFPFCRELPYPYDLAYLLAWLRLRLLPPIINRTNRDVAVRTFAAIFREIATDQPSRDLPAAGANYARCATTIWNQIRLAQTHLVAETSRAYLGSLAAAGLWQAVTMVNRTDRTQRDRVGAVSGLVFSALALRELLGAEAATLPGPNRTLWTDPAAAKGPVWSEVTHRLAQRLRRPGNRRDIVLVLGPEWMTALGLPDDEEIRGLKGRPPADVAAYLDRKLSPPVQQRFSAIGALPLMAVLDWGVFRAPRESITKCVPPDCQLVPYFPGQKNELNWADRQTIPYFYLRGELGDLSTLALTAPERNTNRRKLRKPLDAFSKRRQHSPLVCYVGVPLGILSEIQEYLADIWQTKIEAVFVGDLGAASEYLSEWHIEGYAGTPSDFMAVAEDVALAVGMPATAIASQRTVRVADMSRDADNELISAPGQVISIEVPDDDYQAISRAGHLFLEGIHSTTDLDPRAFLIGHRVTFDQVAADVPVTRDEFPKYLELLTAALSEKRPQTLVIPHRPGAGGSTALRWLAYHLAYDHQIPTLVLAQGGNVAFEAIERMHRVVGRSFLVVADPEDVSPDERQGLYTRCTPHNYRVVFLSSQRRFGKSSISGGSIRQLEIALSGLEKAALIERIGRYCPGLPLGGLMATPHSSMFLLLLMAFRGEMVKIDAFVADLAQHADEHQRFLIGAIAFFGRYAHRDCSEELCRILTAEDEEANAERLQAFDQLLVLHGSSGWHCRHVELTVRILKYILTGGIDQTDNFRWRLAEWAEKLIRRCDGTGPGGGNVADYIWALLNPQLEAGQTGNLVQGEDGLPDSPSRRHVFACAAEQFPDHVNILSHFGKYLSEEENKFTEADHYLFRAYDLEEGNEAVVHMIGMRYRVEVFVLMDQHPVATRSSETQGQIDTLTETAHEWFARAREINLGSEYSYTSAIQLDNRRIKDEFRRIGINSGKERAEALLEERISTLMSHADVLVADGHRYIDPDARQRFGQARDELHYLRGDLDRAISCFRQHIARLNGAQRAAASVRLARFYLERGENLWQAGDQKKAQEDFEEGQRWVGAAMDDPARKTDNIMLWYQCARHVPFWHRSDLIERLEQLNKERSTLDSVFLLMCLYFADAVETGSPASWREYERYQGESARRSAAQGVRTRIREWLVAENLSGKQGKEYRIYPHHLIVKEELGDSPVDAVAANERRVRVTGLISRLRSPTDALLKMEPMGFELFFRPRVAQAESFYKSDEGRTRVSCFVMFTYEKPIGYDVRRI